jgi:UDP-N-acetylmuramoyl-tripeptide--D-alanyl-D-alanine ligase
MFELGKDSAVEHQKVAEMIAESDADPVFLIGENFSKVSAGAGKIKIHKTFEEFSSNFKNLDFDDTTFLIKASRGMALERALDLI